MTRLPTDLAIGEKDVSYNKLMRDLIKPNLLILDDFGMKQMNLGMTQDFMEVIEERYHHKVSILKTRCHLVYLVQVSCPDVIRTSDQIIQELKSAYYKMPIPNRQE